MEAPNLVVSIAAPPKRGKTHLGLTFPDPICVFSFDIGQDPVLKKFKQKEICMKAYPVPIIDTLKPKPYAREIWSMLKKDYQEFLSGNFSTGLIDTGSKWYTIARHTREEELGRQIVPYEYGEVYARMDAFINQAQLAGKNLVITHYMKERWLGGVATGEMILDGYSGTEAMVDVVLEMRKESRTLSKGEKKTIFYTTIKDNRYEPDLDGLELEMATYDDLLAVLLGV